MNRLFTEVVKSMAVNIRFMYIYENADTSHEVNFFFVLARAIWHKLQLLSCHVPSETGRESHTQSFTTVITAMFF